MKQWLIFAALLLWVPASLLVGYMVVGDKTGLAAGFFVGFVVPFGILALGALVNSLWVIAGLLAE